MLRIRVKAKKGPDFAAQLKVVVNTVSEGVEDRRVRLIFDTGIGPRYCDFEFNQDDLHVADDFRSHIREAYLYFDIDDSGFDQLVVEDEQLISV